LRKIVDAMEGEIKLQTAFYWRHKLLKFLSEKNDDGKDSVLITDGNRTYRNLKDIKSKSLKFGKPQSKVYHLNNINNFHSS
jgi:hypothetical protein